jgi:peptidoglycan biosynthesis protein MviN/MurJ (putative lipid II flippase)
MRRSRILIALTTFVGTLLVFATPALAANGGQGWAGETTDKQVTTVMFATIVFFPVCIIVFSLIQSWLDKRHHAREDAERARATSPEWRGGW